jgi:hypothetical protein
MGVCLPVCLPDSVYMSFCLSVWLSVCLFVRMTICLSLFLSICLTLCLSLFLSVWLSICMSVCLSVSLYVCLHVCLSLSPFIFPVLDLEARMWTRVMLYLFCIWIMGLLAPGPWVQCGEILYLNTLNSLPAPSLSYKYNRWKDPCTVQAQPF